MCRVSQGAQRDAILTWHHLAFVVQPSSPLDSHGGCPEPCVGKVFLVVSGLCQGWSQSPPLDQNITSCAGKLHSLTRSTKSSVSCSMTFSKQPKLFTFYPQAKDAKAISQASSQNGSQAWYCWWSCWSDWEPCSDPRGSHRSTCGRSPGQDRHSWEWGAWPFGDCAVLSR